MGESEAVSIGIEVLGAVVRNVPAIANWFAELTHGREDAISMRVKDLLPEESKSAAAMRALEGV